MSSKLDIFNAVVSVLNAAKATGQPLAFVKNIYPGVFPRMMDLPAQSFPAIVVELDDDQEIFFTTGTPPALRSDFKLFVSCLVYEAKPNLGIIGDPANGVTGILEFVDKVKNVLQADMTLGGGLGMQKVQFPAAPASFIYYPVREVKINVTLSSQLTTTSH
jgi:hypothetical protein